MKTLLDISSMIWVWSSRLVRFHPRLQHCRCAELQHCRCQVLQTEVKTLDMGLTDVRVEESRQVACEKKRSILPHLRRDRFWHKRKELCLSSKQQRMKRLQKNMLYGYTLGTAKVERIGTVWLPDPGLGMFFNERVLLINVQILWGCSPLFRVAGCPAGLGIPPCPQTAHRVKSGAAWTAVCAMWIART